MYTITHNDTHNSPKVNNQEIIINMFKNKNQSLKATKNMNILDALEYEAKKYDEESKNISRNTEENSLMNVFNNKNSYGL